MTGHEYILQYIQVKQSQFYMKYILLKVEVCVWSVMKLMHIKKILKPLKFQIGNAENNTKCTFMHIMVNFFFMWGTL